ncbi:MAG: hypothetical protein AAF993_03350 [Pseudomonadota bacterium]
MPTVLFLISAAEPHNNNHQRLPEVFQNAGWQVTCLGHNELSQHCSEIRAGGKPIDHFDLIWPIGFGPRAQFLDRIQILQQLPPEQLITAPVAMLILHGKAAWQAFAPPTYLSNQADELADIVAAKAGRWVLKPHAGSLARQVHQISEAVDIRQIMRQAEPQYWLLQRYNEAIIDGEIRTLVCGREVLGSYRRLPNAEGIANLAEGGQAVPTTLTGDETRLVAQVHEKLIINQVGFAAIDIAGQYLMEANIANPGGLHTLETLYGQDLGARLVSAVNARNHHAQPESGLSIPPGDPGADQSAAHANE